MALSAGRIRVPLSLGRLASILFVLFVILVIAVPVKASTWEKEDYEIFDLVDELESNEGKDVNFYSWLGVSPSATVVELNKAYKKLSLALHPDKNKSDPKAQERFSRLGKIASILRDSASRERYNFFYKNGVPRWRGTGYYYSRFRPGLGLVLGFLVVLANGLQYTVGWVNHHVERRRIRGFVADARETMTRRSPKIQTTTGRTTIEIGRMAMKCEVFGDGKITFFPDDGQKIELDVDEVAKPRVRDVFLIKLPVSIVGSLLGLVTGKKVRKEKVDGDEEVMEEDTGEMLEEEEEEEEEKNKVTRAKRGDTPSGKPSPKPSPAATKVAGGRRKVVRR